jgi:LPXTG-site transpeptidase (sortase) family protein
VTTLASAEVVFPGARIFDRIKVEGLGRSTATIEAELYGPFASRDAIRCTGEPFWRGQVRARGDGELRTRSAKVQQAGFYTYREHLVGSPLLTEYTTMCGEVVETVLARPQINTGRGEIAAVVRARDAGGRTPTRLRLPSLDIDAPVSPAGIDIGRSELAAPADIRRTGWWRDGAAPGTESGSILIAGHVDSAKLGAGAFYRLREARAGDRVQVTTADGRTSTYRVVSVRRYLKRRLPPDIYSLRGEPRLVLVTCGGPFDQATGHYRDNVVLTAVPVS